MELERLRHYLLSKKGAYEDFPFGPQAMVFKVKGKMFALISWGERPLRMNLKCDPEWALHLREIYAAVQPGYHMNKRHWNSIIIDDTLPEEEVFSMMNDSYDLVVNGLTRAEKKSL